MSGSPIYIDGKLVGAVAFAWEFAKDPIAGVTPFSQMVQYVRANDRRIAVEGPHSKGTVVRTARLNELSNLDAGLPTIVTDTTGAVAVSGGGLAGMKPIATPLAATGFTPRALSILADRLGPLGMAPMAGGAAQEDIIKNEGDKPLVPGSPLSIALVTGDFDLSGIGTVTHVEGDRVYAFGHPMMSLGACEFPMMTGYIHTVYPRASVSMKMGSPLKVVGVLDTDVSTAVSGRLGRTPDMMPMTVKVQSGRYAEPHTYHVQIVREPNLLPTLVMTVLANAIDTEGNLPDELTARISVDIALKGHEPITMRETLSGPRYTGPMGPMALFGPIASTVNLLAHNPLEPVRIESIECQINIESGHTVADIESVRLLTDRVEPGQTLRVVATLKPYKGDREAVELRLPIPADTPEGTYEVQICDAGRSLQRRFRNEPQLLEPRTQTDLLQVLRLRAEPSHTAIYLHLPQPGTGLAVDGQPLPDLPGSIQAVFSSGRQTPEPPVRADLIQEVPTPWVINGSQSIRVQVVKDRGLSLDEAR